MKTPVEEACCDKVADLKSNFIKNNFRQISFPVDSANFFYNIFFIEDF